jgi:hypothetical protein
MSGKWRITEMDLWDQEATDLEGTSMSRAGRDDKNLADLDELIGKITVDAYGDDEKLWAFRQAFEDEVPLPADGFVIGDRRSALNHDSRSR